MFFEVMPTEVYRNGGGALVYSSREELAPGTIVLIPLGKREIPGIVMRKIPAAKVKFKTKPVIRIIHPRPLPPQIIAAIPWLSEYYLSPASGVAGLMVPKGILTRNFKPFARKEGVSELKLALVQLNAAQKKALAELRAAPGGTKLLRGVTGSGKTNIYLSLAEEQLRAGKSVILLVPEIALTSQLVAVFRETFGARVTLIHSAQTEARRRQTWLNIHEADEAQVIIGPRSALLAPVHNLGLIIIDEAHEGAYFQESAPRYSAVRLAGYMAGLRADKDGSGGFCAGAGGAGARPVSCVLGSATPSIVDYHLAKAKGALVELAVKAKDTAKAPSVAVVDLKDRNSFTKNRYFSDKLLAEIKKNVEAGHQTLIFHNRRGSAPLTLCENCGWQALCRNCYLPMTLHTDTYTLCCHVCGQEEKVPLSCPNCGKPGIIHKGFGTKLLESELTRLFPEVKVQRFDGDNKKDEDLATLYSEVKEGKINVLIGTQTLARGLDLPKLATVGIVQADAGLSLPDFASEERTFELLTQVIGRVGRGHLDTASVVVQTYQPTHPVIQAALTADYEAFAQYLIRQRRAGHLPPFSHLAKLTVTYKTEKTAVAKIQEAYKELRRHDCVVSPPMPAFHERTARGYSWQLIIRANARAKLLSALAPYVGGGWTVVVDPPSLL